MSDKRAAALHGLIDQTALRDALREQMTEAERCIGDPQFSQAAARAAADAFGTVVDWLEDEYLPGVTGGTCDQPGCAADHTFRPRVTPLTDGQVDAAQIAAHRFAFGDEALTPRMLGIGRQCMRVAIQAALDAS